jgi:hypothetical protein
MGTGTEGGQRYVDLQFSGSETYDDGAAATLLAVPSEVAFDDQYNDWRLGYEPLPASM